MSDEPISEAFQVVAGFGNFFLTKNGSLIAGVELSGYDPDIMTSASFAESSIISCLITAQLPPKASLTQYYVHADAGEVRLRKRDDELNEMLSAAREKALNGRGIAVSKLIHLITLAGPTSSFGDYIKELVRTAALAPIDKAERNHFKKMFSSYGTLMLQETELNTRSERLKLTAEKYASLWSTTMDAKVMTGRELWAFCKYLGTFNERYLLSTHKELPLPLDDLDIAIPEGDIEPVTYKRTEHLKLNAAEPKYLRVAAITSSPNNPTGIWGKSPNAPIKSRGHYIIQTHFSPLTEFQRSDKFRVARTRLDRASLNVKDLLGMADEGLQEDTERLALKEKRLQLEKAESIDDKWGLHSSQICVIGKEPSSLQTTVQELDSNLSGRGLGLTWESAALGNAFMTLQPGGFVNSFRQAMVTHTRAGAFSLVCAPEIGQEKTDAPIEKLQGEEAQYVFETEGGEPFYFSPYTGGRAFIISVGPTRSGKTFLKNTLAANFLKYGGLHRAIDIDAGTETLAKLYGEQGGLFRVDAENENGLNPVSTIGDKFDTKFAAHINQLLLLMLKANDSAQLSQLEEDEEAAIDKAIRATIDLPKEIRDFTSFINHLPIDAQRKFSRWMKDGPYDGLFNKRADSMGGLGQRIGVFNLQAYRDDEIALRPLLLEIFYRITKEFESEKFKDVPKLLEIDEAHHALSLPTFRNFLVSKIRTWGKYGAGVSLWTQSPEDYLRTEGWDAIRSAATTFIFTADAGANVDAYKQAFNLGDGEIEVIKTLQPRREALIVQPEKNIAKRVILQTEPLQVAVNTSTPSEVTFRERMIEKHGFQEGLLKTAEAISRGDLEEV